MIWSSIELRFLNDDNTNIAQICTSIFYIIPVIKYCVMVKQWIFLIKGK